MDVVRRDSLPTVRMDGEVTAYIFEGGTHGVTSSAIIVNVAPGTGPRRHKHPYDEIFILIEGSVRLEADGEFLDLTPDELAVVRAGVPHSFTNIGTGRARMVNINASDTVVTEFTDDSPSTSYEYNHTS
jgi:mannose-6-phosphate isomerase-like protein (cupin superfamily)